MTRLYRIWRSMISRCYFPSATGYGRYGAIGITVCDRWRNSFENFKADMGKPSDDDSIDRIDSAGNYTPENCRWANSKAQANNTRRNIFVDYCGERMTLKQLSEKVGVKYDTLHDKIQDKGLSPEEAVASLLRLST